jgi:Ni/Co efflux regulator RcnB
MYRILALLVAGMFFLACPALAEKPAWAGGGDKGGKHEKKEKDKGKKGHEKGGAHFTSHHREVIRTYYQDQFRAGSCPPGLAKKNNGCLPPGQAKKWIIGQPLPAGIIVYDLPQVIITQLGPPPVGHYYVRVDADILLLTVGTMMVVDALQNLTGN